MRNRQDQVAIIGAGIAGLYTALRLCDMGYRPEKITIYEAGERVGGRILTVSHRNHPSMISDLGARTIRGDHRLVHSLIKRFELPTCISETDRGRQLFLLRGKWKTERQIRRSYFARAFNYNVPTNVQRRSPRRILDRALEKIEARRDQNLPPVALDQFWAEAFHGEEAKFLSDRIGYTFPTEQLNTETIVTWMRKEFFGGSICGLSGGMSRLTTALLNELHQKGVCMKTDHCVEGLAFERDHQLVTIRIRKFDHTKFGASADRAVLALPPKALMGLQGLTESPALKTMSASLCNWPIATASILYKAPWWKSMGLEQGGFCTDGPLGHLNFFSTTDHESEELPARIDLYADGWRSDFWQSMQRDEPAETWVGTDSGFLRAFDAEIAKTFSPRLGTRPQAPAATIFQKWHDGPVGAGIHLWNAGSQPEAVLKAAVAPLGDEVPIHLCNEAWSLRHGWMEGALESAEAMLTKIFGLEPT